MARKTATLPATAVEPELRDALARIAADGKVSLGHVIRQACEAYVEAGESAAPRKPRQSAPVATFKQPGPSPQRAHAQTCKCQMCKP